MLADFATVLVFIVLGAVTVALMLGISRLLHPRNPTAVKLSTYECGEVPFGSSWVQFNIRFYVVALIFLIFDVEVALLYPWAVVFRRLGLLAFVEAFIFIVILLAGLAYLWKEGDLDWVRTVQDSPSTKVGK
ncbi:MAG TPA: NADH-quinone oxidoreductase subunit A [Candidatus Limnocylindria bacterium]|nr:NADH-quinone oxidoreductase subunit A [Candidatus Limnocylindria bacterium]